MDMRDVVGVVSHAAGVDVYWQHLNEFETPPRVKLMRTVISSQGTRLSRTLVHQFDGFASARVDGHGANVQAIWTTADGALMASPVVNGSLEYPEGKLISEYALYPVLACHASECAVVHGSGSQTATILDADSNAVASFALPEGFHPQAISFSERGLFFVRHQLEQMRAALVRRDGSVQYDVAVAAADPAAFHAGPLAIAPKGDRHVVAFVDYAPEPDEVHAVTVSDDGTLSERVSLLVTERHPDLPNNVGALSLAGNGTTYVLTGGYGIGASFVMRYDSAFRPLDAEPQRAPHIPWVSLHDDGQQFVMVWSAARPYVTLFSASGEMTPRIELDPQPRRRAVR